MMGMMLLWVVMLGAGLWLVLSRRRGTDTGDALGVLRARLARGDIDVREFEEREAALREARQSTGPGLLIVVIVAVAVVLAIPMVIVAANGWDMDMWSMHGRGRNTAGAPIVRGGTDEDIRIEDFTFEPGNLEVPVGATVTWTNRDSAPHDATARNGDWNTARLADNESDTLTFSSAGTFEYFCSVHPSMRARLIVR